MARIAAERLNRMKSLEIDQTRRISKVSVQCDGIEKWASAMKFIDENDEVIQNFVWDENEQVGWITHEVPVGHQIIGLYMSKQTV